MSCVSQETMGNLHDGKPAVKTPCMGRNAFSHHLLTTTPVRRRRLDAPYRLLVTIPVTVHESRVTSVQKRMEPRRSLLGASVDVTDARKGIREDLVFLKVPLYLRFP